MYSQQISKNPGYGELQTPVIDNVEKLMMTDSIVEDVVVEMDRYGIRQFQLLYVSYGLLWAW